LDISTPLQGKSLRSCHNDFDFLFSQLIQIIHPPVNRRVHFIYAPLERVTAVLFFALGLGIIFLELQHFVHQRHDLIVLLLFGRVGRVDAADGKLFKVNSLEFGKMTLKSP
jgi:hypothetical protein